MMPDTESAARQSIVDACRAMNTLGINQGTSGNISLRFGGRMLISPSAIPYEEMRADQIIAMGLEDGEGSWPPGLAPSTEWRLHQSVLRARPDVGAVVHGHPTHCTALAINRRGIPACHYMVAAFGGADVRCTDYATYGTAELAALVATALADRDACLLANHGMVVCATGLRRAMWLAVELETLARQYCQALLIGDPVFLTDTQIADTARKLAGYGVQDR